MDDYYTSCISDSNELLTILSVEDDEVKLLEELATIQDEIRKLREDRIAAIARDIQGLLDEQEKTDETGPGGVTPSIDAVESEVSALEERVREERDHLASAEAECRQLGEALDREVAEHDRLRQRREQIKTDAGVALPKARYDVNLYSNISNIRWRYDCGPDEVSGYVCKKNDVKPFSVDKKQVSHFFLVNYLWDLMDEGE